MSDDSFLKEIQDVFLLEAVENLSQTESLFMSLERDGVDHVDTFIQIKRLAHNFKGSGKAVGFDDLASFCHSFENLLGALSAGSIALGPQIIDLLLACNDALKNDVQSLLQDRSLKIDNTVLLQKIENCLNAAPNEVETTSPAFLEVESIQVQTTNKRSKKSSNTSSTNAASVDDHIRLPMKRIEDLFNSFGEQVIYLSALDHFLDNLEENKDNLVRTIFNLKKITFDLQQYTLSLRMVNLKNIFGKLERSIRDAARTTKKNVDYEFIGTDLELDKMIVDQISDPLNHMVRNAVDHGLESTEDRVIAGKAEAGKVNVRAYREAGSFVIEIIDDGKGMDPEIIRRKAIEKGLITVEQAMTESEIFDLIFEPGFSTKEEVSEISGRGVGMSVVKETILTLNGSYEIKSVVGRGTTFRIKLPLSLSLYNGLCFSIDQNRYIIPSSQIIEVINSEEVEIRDIGSGNQVVQIRNEVHPLMDIRPLLRKGKGVDSDSKRKRDMILVSQVDGKPFCFRIHQIIGMMKVVQKPLSPEMTSCPGAVGVTILGDGNPVLILDLRIMKSEFVPERHNLVA